MAEVVAVAALVQERFGHLEAAVVDLAEVVKEATVAGMEHGGLFREGSERPAGLASGWRRRSAGPHGLPIRDVCAFGADWLAILRGRRRG